MTSTPRKTTTRKQPPRKQPARKPHTISRAGKDPHGGLTARGREEFRQKNGSNLEPGVTKPISEMTLEDMRRKGSWAVRFYGRKTLPPLTDRNGKPTRFALSAHAWGEPVPKTEQAARRIADKGRKLLQRYREMKETS